MNGMPLQHSNMGYMMQMNNQPPRNQQMNNGPMNNQPANNQQMSSMYFQQNPMMRQMYNNSNSSPDNAGNNMNGQFRNQSFPNYPPGGMNSNKY